MVTRCLHETLNRIGIQYFSTSPIFIQGLLKKHPEDFIVNEILQDGTILDENTTLNGGNPEGGLYTWMILEKKGIDTPSAIQVISKALRISPHHLQYAGLKDAMGITRQIMSIWNVPPDKISKLPLRENITLKTPRRRPYPVSKDVLKGNNFMIRISNCKEEPSELLKKVHQLTKELENVGILNYYDLQRFGNNRPISHLVGMLLLKGKPKDAAKMYLERTAKNEKTQLKQLRKSLSEGTLSLREFQERIPRKYSIERSLALGILKGKSNPWSMVDKRFVRLFLSAVQSYFFNHMLSRLVELHDHSLTKMRKKLPPFLPVLGKNIPKEKIPPEVIEIYEELALAHELDLTRITHDKQTSLLEKGILTVYHYKRKWNVVPEKLEVSVKNHDMILRFNLPRGSYGTIVAREYIKSNG